MSIEINSERLEQLSIADLCALKEILWYKAQVSRERKEPELELKQYSAFLETMKQIDIKLNDIFILD